MNLAEALRPLVEESQGFSAEGSPEVLGDLNPVQAERPLTASAGYTSVDRAAPYSIRTIAHCQFFQNVVYVVLNGR